MDRSSNYESKIKLRKYAKNLRSTLNMANLSLKIVENIEKQSFFTKSKNILLFYPFNSEPNLLTLMRNNHKNWFLPKVEGNDLTIHFFTEHEELVKNKWGIPEPISKVVTSSIIDLVFIPALMADLSGHRLGYGAGFYDRFLPSLNKDCVKIVPMPDKLLIDSLSCDEWDIAVDWVITESKVIKI